MQTEAEIRRVRDECRAAKEQYHGIGCPFWPSITCCPQECDVSTALNWVLGNMKPIEAETD